MLPVGLAQSARSCQSNQYSRAGQSARSRTGCPAWSHTLIVRSTAPADDDDRAGSSGRHCVRNDMAGVVESCRGASLCPQTQSALSVLAVPRESSAGWVQRILRRLLRCLACSRRHGKMALKATFVEPLVYLALAVYPEAALTRRAMSDPAPISTRRCQSRGSKDRYSRMG
jgi:hypothetical protein